VTDKYILDLLKALAYLW